MLIYPHSLTAHHLLICASLGKWLCMFLYCCYSLPGTHCVALHLYMLGINIYCHHKTSSVSHHHPYMTSACRNDIVMPLEERWIKFLQFSLKELRHIGRLAVEPEYEALRLSVFSVVRLPPAILVLLVTAAAAFGYFWNKNSFLQKSNLEKSHSPAISHAHRSPSSCLSVRWLLCAPLCVFLGSCEKLGSICRNCPPVCYRDADSMFLCSSIQAGLQDV